PSPAVPPVSCRPGAPARARQPVRVLQRNDSPGATHTLHDHRHQARASVAVLGPTLRGPLELPVQRSHVLASAWRRRVGLPENERTRTGSVPRTQTRTRTVTDS